MRSWALLSGGVGVVVVGLRLGGGVGVVVVGLRLGGGVGVVVVGLRLGGGVGVVVVGLRLGHVGGVGVVVVGLRVVGGGVGRVGVCPLPPGPGGVCCTGEVGADRRGRGFASVSWAARSERNTSLDSRWVSGDILPNRAG